MYFLVDYDQKGLEIAKIIGLETIDLTFMKKFLQNMKKIFDLISFVHVIEHLEDPKNEINHLYFEFRWSYLCRNTKFIWVSNE